jgi:hypothetical protein
MRAPTPITGCVGGQTTRPTISGAHLEPVSINAIDLFLSRLAVPAPPHLHLALGARDDDGQLVGVLAAGTLTATKTSIWIVVTPERRRLKIATDLFDTLTLDHRPSITAQLVFHHPAQCPTAASFIKSTGLTARRLTPNQTIVTLP